MTDGIQGINAALRDLAGAVGIWRAQADEAEAVVRSLGVVDAALLGSRAGPVARAVLDGWAEQTAALARTAGANADAVTDFVHDLGLVDAGAAAHLTGLLPFGHELPTWPTWPQLLGSGS